MIIKYKFATGEVTEVDVSDEIGAVITASRKAEHALSMVNAMNIPSRTTPQNGQNASKPLSASSPGLSNAAFVYMRTAGLCGRSPRWRTPNSNL